MKTVGRDGFIKNGESELVMIYLTDSDKRNIKNMHPDCKVYAQFPESMPIDKVEKEMTDFKKTCELCD